MITSSASADCSVAMAMVSLAQRWCGSSTPFNMLSVDELHLLEPLDATPPVVAHMFHELRRPGCKMAVGWSFDLQQRVTKPPTALTYEKPPSRAAPKRGLRGRRAGAATTT